MKIISAMGVALIISAVTACSWGELQTVPKHSGGFDEIGKVLDREPVVIKGDESLASRIVVGTVSAGIIGGVATAITEPGFTKSTAWLYHIKNPNGEYISLVSRSIIEEGDCTSIKKYTVSELPILRREEPNVCGYTK